MSERLAIEAPKPRPEEDEEEAILTGQIIGDPARIDHVEYADESPASEEGVHYDAGVGDGEVLVGNIVSPSDEVLEGAVDVTPGKYELPVEEPVEKPEVFTTIEPNMEDPSKPEVHLRSHKLNEDGTYEEYDRQEIPVQPETPPRSSAEYRYPEEAEVSPEERERRKREVDAAFEMLGKMSSFKDMTAHEIFESQRIMHEEGFQAMSTWFDKRFNSSKPEERAEAVNVAHVMTDTLRMEPDRLVAYERARAGESSRFLEEHAFAPLEATKLLELIEDGLDRDSYNEQGEGLFDSFTPEEKVIVELLLKFNHSIAEQANEEQQLIEGASLFGSTTESAFTDHIANSQGKTTDHDLLAGLSPEERKKVVASVFDKIRKRASHYLNPTQSGRRAYGLAA